MARSDEQNTVARARAREILIEAAIELFGERGVAGASVSEITQRAGVAQGLVSYHFGGKERLVSAVIDRWFTTLFDIPTVEGTPDEVLAGVIDGALRATAYALPLQRAVIALQQQPATHRLFAESEDRFAEQATASEDIIRGLFRDRGAEDPALEEIMLRSNLEGIFMKFSVYGDTFPLEDARRWMHRSYGLPDPEEPLRPDLPPREDDLRLRASRSSSAS